jgi:hypothetical protein
MAILPWRTGLTGPQADIYVLPEGTRYLIVSRDDGVEAAKQREEVIQQLPHSVLVVVDESNAMVFMRHDTNS